jgi:hypothetical protein
VEDPEISYSHLIFNKTAKNILWRKDSLFNIQCWRNWISTYRRVKLDPYFLPCTKINLKWIKDLNLGPETLRLLQEIIGKTLEDIGIGNDFLNRTPVAQQLRVRINKWDYIKLMFLQSKGNNYQNQETAYRMEENLCQLPIRWQINIHNI